MKEIKDCLRLKRKSQHKGKDFKEKQFRRVMEAEQRGKNLYLIEPVEKI